MPTIRRWPQATRLDRVGEPLQIWSTSKIGGVRVMESEWNSTPRQSLVAAVSMRNQGHSSLPYWNPTFSGRITLASLGLTDKDMEEFSNSIESAMVAAENSVSHLSGRATFSFTIDLSDNALTSTGLRTLFACLGRRTPCVSIKKLKLYKNQIEDDGADALVKFIHELYGGFIHYGGETFVLCGMAPVMEELHLSHNLITANGCQRLLENIALLRGLHRHRGKAGGDKAANLYEQAVWVYPRLDTYKNIRLPIWIRMEYNKLQDANELITSWLSAIRTVRNLPGTSSYVCFAERPAARFESTGCTPVKCAKGLHRNPPIVHLYMFHQQRGEIGRIPAVEGQEGERGMTTHEMDSQIQSDNRCQSESASTSEPALGQHLPLYVFVDSSALIQMASFEEKCKILSLRSLIRLAMNGILVKSDPLQPQLEEERIIFICVKAVQDELMTFRTSKPELKGAIDRLENQDLQQLVNLGVFECLDGLTENKAALSLEEADLGKLMGLTDATLRAIDFATLWAYHLADVAKNANPSMDASFKTIFVTACKDVKEFLCQLRLRRLRAAANQDSNRNNNRSVIVERIQDEEDLKPIGAGSTVIPYLWLSFLDSSIITSIPEIENNPASNTGLLTATVIKNITQNAFNVQSYNNYQGGFRQGDNFTRSVLSGLCPPGLEASYSEESWARGQNKKVRGTLTDLHKISVYETQLREELVLAVALVHELSSRIRVQSGNQEAVHAEDLIARSQSAVSRWTRVVVNGPNSTNS